MDLQDLASTPKALQALLGGSTDVVAGLYDGAVQMSIEGKSIQAIAVLERWPPFAASRCAAVCGFPTNVADLKGRVVGVASPGSSTHRFLNYFLVRNGLSLSDITPVGVGVNFSMAAAVQHGQVDAAVAGPLGMALLSKVSPPVILADCRTEEGAQATLGTSNLPSSALMVRPEWARAHPEIIRRLCKATRAASPGSRRILPRTSAPPCRRSTKGKTPLCTSGPFRDIRPAFSPDGHASRRARERARFLSVSDQRARNASIDLQTTYTNEFMQSK